VLSSSNQARVVCGVVVCGKLNLGKRLTSAVERAARVMLKLLALCTLLMGALDLVAGKAEPCDVAWQDISCELQTKKGLFEL
jgi:hypothetical protein